MATGTIKNQPSIIRLSGSVTFTNGVGVFTNANIKATSFVVANRPISSYGVGVLSTYPQAGEVTIIASDDLNFTSNISLLVIND